MHPRVWLRTAMVYIFGVAALICFADAFAQPTDPTTDPNGFFNLLWNAVTERKWGLVAVLSTIALVSLIRKVMPRIHSRLGAWLNSNRGGAVLAVVMGTATALATTAIAGLPITPRAFVDAVVVSIGAIGGWNAMWDLFKPSDKKPAAGATTEPPAPPITKAA